MNFFRNRFNFTMEFSQAWAKTAMRILTSQFWTPALYGLEITDTDGFRFKHFLSLIEIIMSKFGSYSKQWISFCWNKSNSKQVIVNGMRFLLQFRVFVNLFPDEHQREAYKK